MDTKYYIYTFSDPAKGFFNDTISNEYDEGDEFQLPIPTPIGEYEFSHWYSVRYNTSYAAEDTYIVSGADIIEVVWTSPIIRYNISYNGNPEFTDVITNITTPTIVEAGESGMITLNIPSSRLGYRFVEWNTQSNGNGTAYQPGDVIDSVEQDIVLYAIWNTTKETELKISSVTTTARSIRINSRLNNNVLVSEYGVYITVADEEQRYVISSTGEYRENIDFVIDKYSIDSDILESTEYTIQVYGIVDDTELLSDKVKTTTGIYKAPMLNLVTNRLDQDGDFSNTTGTVICNITSGSELLDRAILNISWLLDGSVVHETSYTSISDKMTESWSDLEPGTTYDIVCTLSDGYIDPLEAVEGESELTTFVKLIYKANEGEGDDIIAYVYGNYTLSDGYKFHRDGYAINMWNTAPDGSGTPYRLSENTNITANTTLYAIWREYREVTLQYAAERTAFTADLSGTSNAGGSGIFKIFIREESNSVYTQVAATGNANFFEYHTTILNPDKDYYSYAMVKDEDGVVSSTPVILRHIQHIPPHIECSISEITSNAAHIEVFFTRGSEPLWSTYGASGSLLVTNPSGRTIYRDTFSFNSKVIAPSGLLEIINLENLESNTQYSVKLTLIDGFSGRDENETRFNTSAGVQSNIYYWTGLESEIPDTISSYTNIQDNSIRLGADELNEILIIILPEGHSISNSYYTNSLGNQLFTMIEDTELIRTTYTSDIPDGCIAYTYGGNPGNTFSTTINLS